MANYPINVPGNTSPQLQRLLTNRDTRAKTLANALFADQIQIICDQNQVYYGHDGKKNTNKFEH